MGKPNPRRKMVPIKVSESTYLQIQKASAQANMTISTWINTIIEESLGTIVLPALPDEVRLLSNKIGPNARCVYKGIEITLLELSRRFQVSFIHIHQRLKRNESLTQIVADLESKCH